MRIVKIAIENFRGIKKAELFFRDHTVIVGDNNSGKSTILEAIDLVLGPERLNRYPIIDEHDFYAGEYLGPSKEIVRIKVELVIVDLSSDQIIHFKNNHEYYNIETGRLIDGPPAESTDGPGVVPALRVGFEGYYDEEEDDFTGRTYYLSPAPDEEGGTYEIFSRNDKRLCGFLLLRTLRTGSRALSLERGSLLDIILKLNELRPKMWEDVLEQLRKLPVASNPEVGLSEILFEVQQSIRSFVTAEWGDAPTLRVSDLTRVELREVLTVFMATGAMTSNGDPYSAPFQHQGTGTINTLVLALLVMIAELKHNVIFAMEEPEIAIPPHAQKRIINSIISKTSQAIFTSHSPFVLEEVKPSQILVLNRLNGVASGAFAEYPPKVKPKLYREEFRKRYCEALLSRRVLLTEGKTEYNTIGVLARRLHEIDPSKYSSLEALGICLLDAEGETNVELIGQFFSSLGKTVYAIFDKQTEERGNSIRQSVHYAYESAEKGFENVILNESSEAALRRFSSGLIESGNWPQFLISRKPSASTSIEELKKTLLDLFQKNKGDDAIVEFVCACDETELPFTLRKMLIDIKNSVEQSS